MSEETCPHCSHAWAMHKNRCEACGCLWKPPAEQIPPPTPRELLLIRITDRLWDAFEDQDIYVDRDMDMIDASGMGVDMEAVAAAVLAFFEAEAS